MNFSTQIAKHLRGVYFGGNWASSSLKEHLSDLTWQQATTPVYSFNTIATLAYHSTYYVSHGLLKVLQGGPLDIRDKFSFEHPPINTQKDWDDFLEKVFEEAENVAKLIEQMPESKLKEAFTDEKYGNYFTNILGIIEHLNYHIAQIVLIKKILQTQEI